MSSKFPVSYSRIATFEQCQLKFEYLHVLKSVKDEGNEFTQFGDRVHKQLEAYGKTADPAVLTYETRQYRKLVDRIRAMPGHKWWELQMAIDHNAESCDWFNKKTWARGMADVLVVDGEHALLVDWKTGKVKPDPLQMQIFALLVFIHFPKVKKVKTLFVWLVHDDTTPGHFDRETFDTLLGVLNKKSAAIDEAIELGAFDPNPTYLCRYCPAVNLCPYGSRGR